MNKGFILVWILVSIAILGIIALLSLEQLHWQSQMAAEGVAQYTA